MNEPKQYQQNASQQTEQGADAAPARFNSEQGGRTGTPQPTMPEYGQHDTLEYGARSSQYPVGYDPYKYGRPEEPQTSTTSEQPNNNPAMPQYAQPQGGAYGQPYGGPYVGQNGPQNPYGQQPYGQPSYGAQPSQRQQPHNPANGPVVFGPQGPIDLDDPAQNPMYGHWDSYGILSFIFALFLPVPVLPALFGAVSLWRIKVFHMKGRGLAIAAIIINILYTIAIIWMMVNGVSTSDLVFDTVQTLQGGTPSDSSISA